VEFAATLSYIGADAFQGCSSLPEVILHSEEPPAFGAINLASLPSDFRILVPDSQEEDDRIYLAYLDALSGLLGKEQAVSVLDSISDGAKDRYLVNLAKEDMPEENMPEEQMPEESTTEEQIPAEQSPEEGIPEAAVQDLEIQKEEIQKEEAQEEVIQEKEMQGEGQT
jgi:hypothetical protein